MEELLNDLDCHRCGAHLRGRSEGRPGLEPRRVWMSLGRWVSVLSQTVSGPRGRQQVVSHDRVLCWDCTPHHRGDGMAPDSWRPWSDVVIAPKTKKRKSRKVKT